MAAALLHEPEILFLDEPTSGADPLARRVFWRRITALAEQGVTVIVTTHFMQEAEYCDHIAIMDSGRVLAQGSPARGPRARPRRQRSAAQHGRCLHRRRRALARVNATAERPMPGGGVSDPPAAAHDAASAWSPSCARIRALVVKETRQVVRDPSSIAIGVVLPLILILLFGYGLSLDVKNVPIAVVIENPTPEAHRAGRRAFSSRRIFTRG